MSRCSDSAAAEPLAGSAPTETHWLFVEAPGSWGRDALASSRLSARQRAPLAQLGDHWRVVMVRRADRPLRRQSDRRVWLSSPGRVRRWRLGLDAPVDPSSLGGGEPVDEELLFLCTNGGRDRCCALQGRSLLERLDSGRVWECSHLGGHRFAPTGVRLSDRLVFGRLGAAAARDALAGRTPLDQVRGPAGWPPDVQAAAIAVWRAHRPVPLAAAAASGGQVSLQMTDGTRWQVPVHWEEVGPRLLSCGAGPLAGQAPMAGRPAPDTGRGRAVTA